MNLAIWDIESSSANTSWGSIIEVGGILVDPNFKELDRFNFRCRVARRRDSSSNGFNS